MVTRGWVELKLVCAIGLLHLLMFNAICVVTYYNVCICVIACSTKPIKYLVTNKHTLCIQHIQCMQHIYICGTDDNELIIIAHLKLFQNVRVGRYAFSRYIL